MSHNSELTEAAAHLDQALEHHAAGRHKSVKRRVELARACIARALDPNANPTGAMGAQTSNGQQPRQASDAAVVNRLVASFRAGVKR